MLRSFAAELDGLISVALICRQAHRSLFTEPGNHWEVWDPACHNRICHLPRPFAETAPVRAAAEGAMELAGGWGCWDPVISRHRPPIAFPPHISLSRGQAASADALTS